MIYDPSFTTQQNSTAPTGYRAGLWGEDFELSGVELSGVEFIGYRPAYSKVD